MVFELPALASVHIHYGASNLLSLNITTVHGLFAQQDCIEACTHVMQCFDFRTVDLLAI